MSGPLSHIKVLDLAWVVAGPMIGRSLADFGATVVRVEHPKRTDTARAIGPYYGGGYDVQRSACYANGNAGKLGLALDLQNEDARDVVRELAAWADIVVESFAPGQVNRWGLDYETLKAINPKIIMVSTSLMGQSGPWKALAGFGNIGTAMSGYQGLVGPEEGLPTGPFGPYTDYVAPRFGIPMVLAAIDWRERSGEGCYIDLGQAETGMQFLASAFADYGATGRIAKAEGNRDDAMAPHGVYPALTQEGEDPRWIAVVAQDDAAWKALAAEIGGDALDDQFASLEGRKAHEAALDAIVGAWTASLDPTETAEKLQGLGVAASVVATAADLAEDPQLEHLGHWERVPHPQIGAATVEGSRFVLSKTPAHVARPAPEYGRDQEAVLKGILGYDSARLDALKAAGAMP